MLNETDWIRTPHIRPDSRGPIDRPYRPFTDPAVARPIIDTLQSIAVEGPDRPVIDGDGGSLGYGSFLGAVLDLKDRLGAAGPVSGPVGILLPSDASYAVAVFGCLAAGYPSVLMDQSYPEDRNRAIAAMTGVRLVLTTPERMASLDWPNVSAAGVPSHFEYAATSLRLSSQFMDLDQPAIIMCTSGSSGMPKPIVHSQRTMLHWARTTHDALHVRADDRVLSLSSFSSLGGFTALLSYPLAGASMQMLDLKANGLDGLMTTLARRPVTILRAAPSLLRGLALLPEAQATFAKLRVVQNYGEPFLKADLVALKSVLPGQCLIRSTYGSTEASGMSWFAGEPDEYDPVRVATGTLMPDTAAAIVDDEGQPCRPGQDGEILIRSVYNALGEWIDGRLVLGRLVPHPSGDGTRVFYTNDIGRYHPDGVFVVLGRKDRMLKVNGQRLEPAEIEGALRRMESVERAEVAVDQRAIPAKLVAFVVPRGHAEPGLVKEIRAKLRAQLPSFMIPSRIILVSSIPLLAGGKVDSIAMLKMADNPAGVPLP